MTDKETIMLITFVLFAIIVITLLTVVIISTSNLINSSYLILNWNYDECIGRCCCT